MRKDILAKVEFIIIMLVLIIIVVFGKDIMAAINGTMEVQAESLIDQLLRQETIMGKIYMTACMKGGCAKTVTTYNLAYSLKKLGKKVLCVDFDSQANLSTCFGVEDTATVPVTIGHLMMAWIEDEELSVAEEYIQSRNGENFISSSMVLSAVDAKLRLEMGAEKML